MSRSINKVILIGHLGADPETRALPSGDSIANLSLATSESWTDKGTGEARERTDWHRIVIFGRLAEIAAQFLQSGSRVYVEGKLRTRQYQTQDGDARTVTEVVIDSGGNLLMLDGRPDSAAQSTGAQPRAEEGARSVSPKQGTGSRGRSARGLGRFGRPTRAAAAPEGDDPIPF